MTYEGENINEKVSAIVKFSTICERYCEIYRSSSSSSSSSTSSSSSSSKLKKDDDNDKKMIQNCICIMINDATNMLSYSTDYGQSSSSSLAAYGDPEVYINIHSIIKFIKEKTLHSIACNRFNKWTGRVVRLLLQKKYVEQGKLGEMAIIPSRDARELLYWLYRERWIDYLEISKRNDFNPASTYYFWTLDKKRIIDNILNTNYKAMVNLRLRKSHEMVLSASQGFDINNDIMTNDDKDKYETEIERLKIVYARLDEGVFLLDDYIMLHELF
jgi:DNA-directed RNA polymerase III subunit RPC3